MLRSRRLRTTLLIGAIAALAVILAVIALRTPDAPAERATDLRDARRGGPEATGSVEASASAITSPTPGTPAPQPAPAPAPAPAPDATPSDAAIAREAPTGAAETRPGRVLAAYVSGGSPMVRIDYVQFLTGGEAADAAAVHGDESPPPNDYYIVNDDPTVRDVPVRPGISVTVVTDSDGTAAPAGRRVPLEQWIAALNGPYASAFRTCVYWVTISDGTISAIEAQYTP